MPPTNTTIMVRPRDLPLQCLYRWERERAKEVYLTQPLGAGQVQDITWAQALEQVRRVAHWLQSQGWPAGSRVAIVGKNSAHWILSDLAIWMAGHVSVPIYPTFNAQAIAYILEHSQARACFIGKLDDSANVRAGLPPALPRILLPLAPPALEGTPWQTLLADSRALAGEPVRDGDEVCTIIYTSGTTGQPKGVVHTFNTMAWAVSSATRRFPMGPQERYLSYLPLAHVAERMLIEQGALRHGGRVFFAESIDSFVQDLQRARPTIFFSVPRLWVKFQQGVHRKLPEARLRRLLAVPLLSTLVRRKILKGLGLDQCRVAAGGAAPMPAEVLRWYRQLGLDLVEVYGMTENAAISHCTLAGSKDVGTVGYPYEGVEHRVDPDSGEIQMRSPAMMRGYYLEPELSADAFTPDGWLRTGDKGRLDARGALSITGRVKDIFKTAKGKYVAPARLEELLVHHSAVEACLVSGANLAQPLALVLLAPEACATARASAQGREQLTQAMAAHLQQTNERLEPHEKLALLVLMTEPWTPENGFVTPTLKVKRPVMETAFAPQFDAWLAQGQPVVWAQEP
ncbi:MAG: AMP-binding protein [Rhodoferax sp.]